MSVYYYEPTYSWDRFFDDWVRSANGSQAGQGQVQRQGPIPSDVQRFLKPKYVFFSYLFHVSIY